MTTLIPTGIAGIPIAHARKAWNPNTNQGEIDIQLANGQNLTIPLNGAMEFLAVSVTLNEPHAVLMPNGTIIGWR